MLEAKDVIVLVVLIGMFVLVGLDRLSWQVAAPIVSAIIFYYLGVKTMEKRSEGMGRLERAILKWLEARDEDWCWFFGGVKYDKKATVEKFKKDKKFRKLIIEAVEKTAIEMFESHLKREQKSK